MYLLIQKMSLVLVGGLFFFSNLNMYFYTPGIYAAGYIVFALTFVRSSVRMFVRSFVRSFVCSFVRYFPSRS